MDRLTFVNGGLLGWFARSSGRAAIGQCKLLERTAMFKPLKGGTVLALDL
jgi:hypothetical protein